MIVDQKLMVNGLCVGVGCSGLLMCVCFLRYSDVAQADDNKDGIATMELSDANVAAPAVTASAEVTCQQLLAALESSEAAAFEAMLANCTDLNRPVGMPKNGGEQGIVFSPLNKRYGLRPCYEGGKAVPLVFWGASLAQSHTHTQTHTSVQPSSRFRLGDAAKCTELTLHVCLSLHRAHDLDSYHLVFFIIHSWFGRQECRVPCLRPPPLTAVFFDKPHHLRALLDAGCDKHVNARIGRSRDGKTDRMCFFFSGSLRVCIYYIYI
jgi:hypothetical protein